MGAPEIISGYESLSALTGQMHDAAVRGDWDVLVDLEKQCSRQVELIKRMNVAETLDEPSRQRKVQLIKSILEHDADIRIRTTAWMTQLQGLMQSNRQEQRLQQAYGS